MNITLNSGSRSGAEYNNLFIESARTYSYSSEKATTFTCYEAAMSSTNDACLAWLTSMEAGQTALLIGDYPNAVSFFTKACKFAENDTEKNLAGIEV